MRILQIIDSLEAGGAERMAVNFANALADKIEFSGLVTTRKEGSLLKQINCKVEYLFLRRVNVIDFKALMALRSFVIKNNIGIIHAHSTSIFFTFLLKISLPHLKLVWHDHYGNSEFLSNRSLASHRIMIPFFDGIIAVNEKLKLWAKHKLKFKNVIYLPNFADLENDAVNSTQLYGVLGKRIVCLANLREQKNHFLLIEIANKLKKSHPDWSFHLIGKDFNDDYSKQIKDLITTQNLENSFFLYGSKNDIKNILNQSEIALLTSKSEGLPLALLEYGMNKKPILTTDVGEIPNIIQHGSNGFLVSSNDGSAFYKYLITLIENKELRTTFGNEIFNTIEIHFSQKYIIEQYLKWLRNEN
jgi:glycosyltransferase involved in cell wall biosynthesis